MSGSQIKQPNVSITIANANATVSNTPQKVLFVGQMITGTGTAGVLETNLGNAGEEDALFGASSQIAGAIRAFRKKNGVNRVDAFPLADDGSGVPRVVGFTLLGTASAAGTITVIVGSEKNHKFVVAIASSDDVTAQALAIKTAVNADLDCPYTADSTAGAVTLTSDNDGTVANEDGVEIDIAVTGVTLTVALNEATAGATDPSLTGITANLIERYQGISWPYRDKAEIITLLASRFNASNAILDGVAFQALTDTLGNFTDGSTGILDVLNDGNIVIFCDQDEADITGTLQYIGPSQIEIGYAKVAEFLAIRALRLTDGESISAFVTSRASRDQIGGVALASLPYFNTPMANLPLIRESRGWTDTEIETLFDAGGSVMGVNTGGTGALVGEVVTTYKTDAASNPDPTFQFLNYVDTEVNIREYRFNNAKARFAQSRLTEGSLARNRDMANQSSIRAFFEKLYFDTSGDDFVLTQGGDAAIAFYKANLTVSLNLATGTVTVTDLTPIVTQLRTIIMTMKVAFTVT